MILPSTTQSVTSELPAILRERLHMTHADIVAFCQRWQIQELALFGSVLRQDFHADSDIDVLVIFEPDTPRTPFHRIQSQADLEALIGRDVDLTEKALLTNPLSQQEILSTHYSLYPTLSSTPFEIKTSLMVDQERLRNTAAVIDMMRAIEEIQEDTYGLTYNDYRKQRLVRRAVERNCEIIGEAARRISPSFCSAHSDIDWRGAINFRNVIIHQYDQVNDQEVWVIVSSVLPKLLKQLQPLKKNYSKLE